MVSLLKFSIYGYHKVIESTLQTDFNGRIKLGHLDGVRNINSNFISQGDIEISSSSFNL